MVSSSAHTCHSDADGLAISTKPVRICEFFANRSFRDGAVCADQAEFKPVVVTPQLVEEALGNRKYDHQLQERILTPGVAIGLAYTAVGGSALLVETALFPGSGQLRLTGKLGEVMRESVNTSISWI